MSLEEYKDWNKDQVSARYKELKKEAFDLRLKDTEFLLDRIAMTFPSISLMLIMSSI